MTQKGQLKLVDKYQFNEKKFTTVEGGRIRVTQLTSSKQFTLTPNMHILSKEWD